MISLDGVTKVYPGSSTPAVTDLDLDIGRGEFVTLVGPSGCGKTTTLKMINRIIEPTDGSILIDGNDAMAMPAHELRRSIGYVIQQIGLFPHRTIGQNIATVPQLLGWDQSRISDRVAELVGLVGLEIEMLDRYPSQLSGGQRQRVGVARALAADPPVLLMDEPFGAVDPIVRHRLQQEFLELQRELGKTVVFVTHDIDEAILLGTRIAILNVGGILEQYDSPERILREPANEFVKDFIGGERGLKRLGLLPISSAEPVPGPFVERSVASSEARRVMDEYETDWFGILDNGRLLGWAWAADLDGGDVSEVEPKEFLVRLAEGSSLRAALDAVVTGHARTAVVVGEGDKYLGMLDLDAIAEEITE